MNDHGIPVGNQSVLLRGVNDDPEVMKELVQGLLKIRVKPYYLYQADLVTGTSRNYEGKVYRYPIDSEVPNAREAELPQAQTNGKGNGSATA